MQDEDEQTLQYYSYLRGITETEEITYWIGNPSVEIINGTIYLKPFNLKKRQKEPENFELYLKMLREDQQSTWGGSRCLLLAGIPNCKTPVEVLESSNIERLRELVKEIRVVKTAHIRYYAMLLLFESQKGAETFTSELFGQEYNQVEMERIVLREITGLTLCFSELSREG